MKKAQVWIETVIYTLIGIAIIGILLSVVLPKVNSMRDKLTIEQTITSLTNLHATIADVQNKAPGNKREIDITVSKGRFVIDSANDAIIWKLDSTYQYSAFDTPIDIGALTVNTIKANPYEVDLSQNYTATANITTSDREDLKELAAAPSPYKIFIENKGPSPDGRTQIDITAR